MRLRIESDGTGHGTRVFDELGEPVQGIIAITWSIEVGGLAAVDIKLRGVPVSVVGEAEE